MCEKRDVRTLANPRFRLGVQPTASHLIYKMSKVLARCVSTRFKDVDMY